jgi:hypothetical protein
LPATVNGDIDGEGLQGDADAKRSTARSNDDNRPGHANTVNDSIS